VHDGWFFPLRGWSLEIKILKVVQENLGKYSKKSLFPEDDEYLREKRKNVEKKFQVMENNC